MKISNLIRQFFIVAGGTAFAQLISLLTLPILTRLYPPDVFGSFAIYSSIVAVLSLIFCFRYDFSLPTIKCTQTAKRVFSLSILIAVLFLFFSTLILLVFFTFSAKANHELVLLSVVGSFFLACFNSTQFYHIRNKKFRSFAFGRIFLVLSVSAIQYALFYFIPDKGIVYGAVLGAGLVAFTLVFFVLKDIDCLYQFKTLKKTMKVAYLLRAYPKVSILESLFNSASIHTPLILIGLFVDAKISAYMFLTLKVFQAPITLIGGALSKVYYSNSNKVISEGRLAKFTLNLTVKNFIFVCIPLIFLIIMFKSEVMGIFGTGWSDGERYLFFMLPWVIAQQLYLPVSTVFSSLNRLDISMKLQAAGFIVRFIPFMFFLQSDSTIAIYYFYASNFVFYLVCILVSFNLVRKNENSIFN